MFKFPFTNYQEINLDWIIKKVRELIDKVEHDSAVVTDYEARLIATENAAAAAVETADTAADTAAAAQTTAGNALDRSIDTENNLTDFENNTIGPLSGLTTTDKSSIVAAINEAARSGGGGGGGGAVESVNGQTGVVVLDASDVGALPDSYTAPVTSVNGQTGAVVIPAGAVDSVNGQTGDVVLDASDVGALPDSYTAPVTKVNGMTGIVSTAIRTTFYYGELWTYSATQERWEITKPIDVSSLQGHSTTVYDYLCILNLTKTIHDRIMTAYPDCKGIEILPYSISTTSFRYIVNIYTSDSVNNPNDVLSSLSSYVYIITSEN